MSIRNDISFHVLDEAVLTVLGHIYETVYSINKLTGNETEIFSFYGDPTCGLIANRNDWQLIGGDALVLKTRMDSTTQVFDDTGDIHSLKPLDNYSAQILTDPWNEKSAIWQLSIKLSKVVRRIELKKVHDFTKYIDQPFVEQVKW